MDGFSSDAVDDDAMARLRTMSLQANYEWIWVMVSFRICRSSA
jgi:hypothetical protein